MKPILLILLFTLFSCKPKDFEQIVNVHQNKTDTLQKLNSETYFFNTILKEQIFPIEFSRDQVENEFKNKIISLDKNILTYSNCFSEIRQKTSKAINYFNGKQNVEIYNQILSEVNLKLDDEINSVELLYPENNCNLPSEQFILLHDKLFFVFEGYIILFDKSKKEENTNSVNNKIVCEKEEGNLESGFTTNCIISKKLNEAYIFFIKESKINEVQYLKTILPKSNIKYVIQNVDVSYNFEKNKLQINLSFDGGESENNLFRE